VGIDHPEVADEKNGQERGDQVKVRGIGTNPETVFFGDGQMALKAVRFD
jgi:hypothetical protein